MPWEFLRNIVVNLHATGPAAVMISWIAGIVCLAIFGGDSAIAKSALGVLSIVGGGLLYVLAQRPPADPGVRVPTWSTEFVERLAAEADALPADAAIRVALAELVELRKILPRTN